MGTWVEKSAKFQILLCKDVTRCMQTGAIIMINDNEENTNLLKLYLAYAQIA